MFFLFPVLFFANKILTVDVVKVPFCPGLSENNHEREITTKKFHVSIL